MFVATTGNDSNNGRSLATPLRTIQAAANLAQPGDVIALRGGQYSGATIGTQGRADAWITIKPYNGENVVINGSSRNVAIYFRNSGFQPVYWIMDGLEVDGGDVYSIQIDTPQVKILNNNLHGSGRDVVKLVSTANDVTIAGNEIHSPRASNGTNAQGVDIVGADRTLISGNYVHDIPSVGMYAKGNARDTVFEKNLLVNIYYHGIQLGQATNSSLLFDGNYESYNGIIRNNVIINTRGACLGTSSSYNARIYNNSCYNAASAMHGAIFIANQSEVGQAGTNIEIKNNIIVTSTATSRPAIMVASNALTSNNTLDVNNNIYWTSGGAGQATFTWGDLGLWSVSFSRWRSTTALDSASIVSDPLYSSLSTLTIDTSSRAIDAGIDVSFVLEDYLGVARPGGSSTDIGAYEFISNSSPSEPTNLTVN